MQLQGQFTRTTTIRLDNGETEYDYHEDDKKDVKNIKTLAR